MARRMSDELRLAIESKTLAHVIRTNPAVRQEWQDILTEKLRAVTGLGAANQQRTRLN